MGLAIILIIIYFVIAYIIADEFYWVAVQKGYEDRRFFWYCFLFGIAGYLLVIALPENKSEEKSMTCD